MEVIFQEVQIKKKCEYKECEKNAVIIEDKKYYCAECYIDKFIGVYKRLRFKPVHDSVEPTNKGEKTKWLQN